jgi:AcrR family transcriptional regulator
MIEIVPPGGTEFDATTTKGARTRRALLAAAIERFARDGYRATSVAEVARAANLSSTAAYVYFPNKEALFIAAVDEDAAGVVNDGLGMILDPQHSHEWREGLLLTLLESLEDHPLARRVLAGLEPDFTVRLLDIPVLAELRKASAEQLRTQQLAGEVRADIDADRMAGGLLTIVLSMLMSLVQTGLDPSEPRVADVHAVFDAALGVPPDVRGKRSRELSRRRRKTS